MNYFLFLFMSDDFIRPIDRVSPCLFIIQVTHHTQRYLKEIEMREEGGTPDIVGSIRAGLVFQLKQVCWRVNLISLLFKCNYIGEMVHRELSHNSK